MIKLGITFELTFLHNLFDLGFELISPNIFFNLLDVAFGYTFEQRKIFPIIVILSIFAKAEKYILQAKSFRNFIEILKFSGKFIFNFEDLSISINYYTLMISKIPKNVLETIDKDLELNLRRF